MARREKLIDKMRNRPGSIRFTEVTTLLKYEGFVLFNQRGSHGTYHRADGRLLTKSETTRRSQDVLSIRHSTIVESIRL